MKGGRNKNADGKDIVKMGERNWLAALAVSVWVGASVPAGDAAVLDVLVADHKGRPVANMVVHATPVGGNVSTRQAQPPKVVIEQKGMRFIPFVSALRKGTVVSFPNNDRVAHHVYSFSPAKVFELPLYKGESPISVEFDQPGPVTLGCNIHDWMVAYVYVVETPFYGVTRGQGRLRLDGLPPGEYRVEVWHPGLKGSLKSTRTVVSVAQSGGRADFSIKLRAERFWRPKSPI